MQGDGPVDKDANASIQLDDEMIECAPRPPRASRAEPAALRASSPPCGFV
eukprot:SAG11_NODE_34403_length_272_cov_0.601156_1_plen_49_part_01